MIHFLCDTNQILPQLPKGRTSFWSTLRRERLHDHSGAGGSISHLFRVCPPAATESWTGERRKAMTIRDLIGRLDHIPRRRQIEHDTVAADHGTRHANLSKPSPADQHQFFASRQYRALSGDRLGPLDRHDRSTAPDPSGQAACPKGWGRADRPLLIVI